jgi:nicotinate-nucleotide adenylyltransferase
VREAVEPPIPPTREAGQPAGARRGAGDRRRIGVFGGTFDPPHVGHLAAATEVAHRLALDRLLLVVAHVPWQKVDARPITASPIRLEMVEAAVAGHPPLEASDLEIRRGGESYTADTLEELARSDPDADLLLVIGSDVAPLLPTWKRPEELRGLAELVLLDRPGHDGGRPPSGWPFTVVEIPALEISSSDVRARVHGGRPIDYLVPDPVAACIRRHGLYLHDGLPHPDLGKPSPA